MIGAVILFIIGLFAYSPSFNCEFTNWDDEVYVVENDMIYNLGSQNLKRIFTEPVSANYHPITMLSLAINYKFSKLQPAGYHITNVIVHLLNILLVFYFIFYLSKKSLIIAFVTAFIFGIHPMHVESVTWVAERKDVLYGFFFLLGSISYLRYVRQGVRKFLWYTLLLFMLSVLSKAMAVVFPLVLLLIDFWEGKDLKDKSLWVEKIPFFLISIIFGILAIKVQSEGGAVGSFETFALHHRFMFAGYGFLMYLYKFIVPVGLSTYYPYPNLDEGGFLPAFYYIAPLITALLLVAAFVLRNRFKWLFFGIGFYLVTVILVLQIMSVGQVVMADRYTYLPYIGIGLIVGYLLQMLWSNENIATGLKYAFFGMVGALFLWFTYGTYERAKVWENSEVLWTNVIDQYPFVGLAYKNRGNFRARNGNPDEGLKDFDIALQLLPDDSAIYESLGNTWAGKGQVQKAIGYYNSAIEKDPEKSSAYLNRAIAYSQLGQYQYAFPDYEQALQMGQKQLSVLPNRAYAYLASGRFQESINDYEISIRLNPNNGSYYYFLSEAYRQIGNSTLADQNRARATALGYNPQ